MSPDTIEVLTEIKRAVTEGQQSLIPAIFSACYPRAAVSAAFRVARARKIIEVAYTSAAGTPVYRAAGIAEAIEQAKSATKN